MIVGMFRRALETLAAGFAVYALMAACSGSGARSSDGGTSGMANAGGYGGQGGVFAEAGTPGDGGIMSPVPDAMAAGGSGSCECEPYEPPEPTIVEADCEAQDGSPAKFAVAEFPGKTADELAHVLALVEYDPADTADFPSSYPAGFGIQVGVPYVKDGWAAVQCGSTQISAVSVSFVLP